jgi:hypothetical protein
MTTDDKKTTNEEIMKAYDAFLNPAPAQPNPNAKPLANAELEILLLFLAAKHYGAKE